MANIPGSQIIDKPSLRMQLSNHADNQINQQATFANNQQSNVGGSTAQSAFLRMLKTLANFGTQSDQTQNSEHNFNQNAQVQPNVQAQQQVPNAHVALIIRLK